MHITLESDYAVRIVYCLAACRCRKDAKAISEKTGVTLRFSLKILRKLVASGIIKSYKGTQGGYELAKEPDQISLREVIETVEGPVKICRCLGDDFNCNHRESENCRFQKVFNEVSVMVQNKLESVKFSDLLPSQSAGLAE